MCVDEGLKPSARGFVADLEGVGEDEGTIVLGEVLELGLGEVLGVERAVELLLSSRNGVLDGDGRGGRRNFGGLDERRAEGDNLVVVAESNVGDRVGNGDAVLCVDGGENDINASRSAKNSRIAA